MQLMVDADTYSIMAAGDFSGQKVSLGQNIPVRSPDGTVLGVWRVIGIMGPVYWLLKEES